jgi:regulator of protease activity HflC (stomatin/prohibitin superfamily)
VDSALAWIGQLAEWIGRFFPRFVILTTVEGGVKFVHGSRVVALGPGLHCYWPLVTVLETFPTARQTDNLPTQTLTTKDDKVVAVGGMVIYEVNDVEKLLAYTHDGIKTIQDCTLTTIHDVCCNMTWDELKAERRRGTLNTKLKNASQKELSPYGVRVIKCMLTDLAPTRVYKILQSTGSDGVSI